MRRCTFLNVRRTLACNRHSSRRGVGFVWFAVIGIPVMFFVAALTTDLTRIVTSHRQMVLVAEAAANAGAATLDGTSTTGKTAEAAAAAEDVYQRNIEVGAVDFLKPMSDTATVTVDAAATQVTVNIEYDVDGLRFLRFFESTGDSETFRVARASSICEPGARPATDDHCARPG